ncbi:TetR/AcrR family transcriptional regulator [Terrarubrum flagellatum]|uniref:TetR/AcrR family transcriptional regulator n=1 Tax=Terrirubrum flagellatum TaxID=2895980 RepID=UPI003144E8B7
MKVSREQAAQNREKIVAAASRLFREHGFDGVSVADLMKEAGLTHGGFYGHFSSKEELAAEACGRSLSRSAESWASIAEGSKGDAFAALVSNYLSRRHSDVSGKGCALPALGSDGARQGGDVRKALTRGLLPLVAKLEENAPARTKTARRKKALATMAGLVGAVTLARMVDDPVLSEEILRATESELLLDIRRAKS